MDRHFPGKLVELCRQQVILPERDKDLVVAPEVDVVGTFEVE